MLHPRAAGVSLAELTLVLCLTAILLALAALPLRRILDRTATAAARDELAAALARTRAAAVGAGGAQLVIQLQEAVYHIERADGVVVEPPRDLTSLYDVRLATDGSASARVAIVFDGLGIGRLASRTIRIRRGDAEAGLTVSAYGRVRRW
jgi:hypothetical protein